MSRFFSSIMPLLSKRHVLFSRIIKKQTHSEKCMITTVENVTFLRIIFKQARTFESIITSKKLSTKRFKKYFLS
jgi:hypothetical protein